MRRVVAAPPDDVERRVACHSAVADLEREIVEKTREAEFVPFEPMVDGDELVVDISEVVIARLWPVRPPETMGDGDGESRLGIPRLIIAEEDRIGSGGGEFLIARPGIGRHILLAQLV